MLFPDSDTLPEQIWENITDARQGGIEGGTNGIDSNDSRVEDSIVEGTAKKVSNNKWNIESYHCSNLTHQF